MIIARNHMSAIFSFCQQQKDFSSVSYNNEKDLARSHQVNAFLT